MLLTEYIKNQETPTRVTNFKDFASKKRLTEANLFTEEQMKQIGEIRNAISFSVHNDKKYLIASIYDRSKTYKFLVINTEDMTVEELPTIKTAKQHVLALIETETGEKQPEEDEEEESTGAEDGEESEGLPSTGNLFSSGQPATDLNDNNDGKKKGFGFKK